MVAASGVPGVREHAHRPAAWLPFRCLCRPRVGEGGARVASFLLPSAALGFTRKGSYWLGEPWKRLRKGLCNPDPEGRRLPRNLMQTMLPKGKLDRLPLRQTTTTTFPRVRGKWFFCCSRVETWRKVHR